MSFERERRKTGKHNYAVNTERLIVRNACTSVEYFSLLEVAQSSCELVHDLRE